MPYSAGAYNIHTNVTDLGASVTVSEIDGLERVTTDSGSLSLSGADVVDINNIVAAGVTTQSIISAVATLATATIDALTATAATMTSATIDALTATTATIRDLTVVNLNMDTLTVRELFASVVSIDNKLDVYGQVSVFGDTYTSRDMIVGGSFTAGNVIKYAGSVTLSPDGTGEYVWQHAPLKAPVVHLAHMVTGPGGRPIITCLEYSELDYATWRFFQMSFIGPAAIGGTIQVCFLAIGG
jgi:hypothetical protein